MARPGVIIPTFLEILEFDRTGERVVLCRHNTSVAACDAIRVPISAHVVGDEVSI